MVKSPWSITGRQKRWTSRAQARCSSGVPLRCWAMAPVDADIDKSVSAKTNLRIIFLHSGTGEFRSRTAQGVDRNGFFRIAGCRQTAATSELEALANAAKFTTARSQKA